MPDEELVGTDDEPGVPSSFLFFDLLLCCDFLFGGTLRFRMSETLLELPLLSLVGGSTDVNDNDSRAGVAADAVWNRLDDVVE